MSRPLPAADIFHPLAAELQLVQAEVAAMRVAILAARETHSDIQKWAQRIQLHAAAKEMTADMTLPRDEAQRRKEALLRWSEWLLGA